MGQITARRAGKQPPWRNGQKVEGNRGSQGWGTGTGREFPVEYRGLGEESAEEREM